MLPLLRRASTTTGRFRTGYRTMSANPPDFKQFNLALIQLGRAPYLAENPTETEIKDANLKHARDMIDRAVKSSSGKPDLVVLPVRRSSVPPSLSIMIDSRNASTRPMAMYTFLCMPKPSAIHLDKNTTSQRPRVRASKSSQMRRQRTGFGSLEVHRPFGTTCLVDLMTNQVRYPRGMQLTASSIILASYSHRKAWLGCAFRLVAHTLARQASSNASQNPPI